MAVFTAASCKKEPELKNIILSDTDITISEGEVYNLTAELNPSIKSLNITWSSMDESVATVDANGTVTGVYGGRTFIMANAGGISKGCSVTVVANVSSVIFRKHKLTLAVNGAEELLYDVTPERALNKNLVWSSENPDIAYVSNGVVVAKALGQTRIKACSVTNPDAFDICDVDVIVPVTQVIVSPEKASLWIGETLQLTGTVLPEDATDKSLVWHSSDETVATVSETALVTALSVGKVVVAAVASDGMTAATCEIDVCAHVDGVTLDVSSIAIYPLETRKLTATVSPSDAFNKNVLWSVDDASVATVDENGVVTGLSVGNAVVTATTEDGGFTAQCSVEVKKGESEIESISFEKDSYRVVAGRTTKVNPIVLPVDAADKSVVWTSSDTAVATVDADGMIKGVVTGTVTITATSVAKTSVKGSFKLDVIDPQSFETEEFNEDNFQNIEL